jgi:hypothetical protein
MHAPCCCCATCCAISPRCRAANRSNNNNMAQNFALCAILALALAGSAAAYPQFWANEYAPSCFAVPKAGTDCHKNPQQDR